MIFKTLSRPKNLKRPGEFGHDYDSDVVLPPIGAALEGETRLDHDCLSCANFSRCKNPGRGYQFICDSYSKSLITVSLDDYGEDANVIQPFAERAIHNQQQRFTSDTYLTDDQIQTIVDDVIDSAASQMPVDFKIDDRDMPEAKNFYEFCVDRSFLGIKPYAKQLETGLHLFTEICHNPHCTNPAYLRDIPYSIMEYEKILENVTLLEHGVCPRCGTTKFDLWQSGRAKDYNELIGVAGQRSGKSAGVAMYAAYVVHRYLKLQNPLRLFGLDPNGLLQGTITATELSQARKNIFTPLYMMCSDSHWFSEYHKLLDYYQGRYGRELYKFQELSFTYNHRRITVAPATPNKKGLRGATRFFAAIDELGWFFAAQKGAIKLDPDEIYAPLANSMLNARSAVRRLHEQGLFNVPAPLFCNVTSPSSGRDKAMRLLKEATKSDSIHYFHLPSWEMNPTLSRQELDNLRHTLGEVAFNRDFGANPPDASNPFIANKVAIEEISRPRFINKIRINQMKATSPAGMPMTSGEVRISKKIGLEQYPSIMTLDAGSHDNSFAIAVCHPHTLEDGQTVVTFDAIGEIIPEQQFPINFNAIYENILLKIVEAFNVKYVAADRWNSKKLLDDLDADAEIAHAAYSLKYDDFTDFRNALYNGLVRVPKTEMPLEEAYKKAAIIGYPQNFAGTPIAHLQVQLLTVEDQLGKTVVKGEKMTDDLFRAVVLGYAMAIDTEVQSTYLMDIEDRSRRGQTIGVVGSYQTIGVGGMGASSIDGGIAAMGSGQVGGMSYQGQTPGVFSGR